MNQCEPDYLTPPPFLFVNEALFEYATQERLLSVAIAGGLLSAATAQAGSDPDLAGKNVVLVHGVDASHVPMLSKPHEVAAAIISAARQAK
jgi:hypothetical protein